jgi:hypothetical protein
MTLFPVIFILVITAKNTYIFTKKKKKGETPFLVKSLTPKNKNYTRNLP